MRRGDERWCSSQLNRLISLSSSLSLQFLSPYPLHTSASFPPPSIGREFARPTNIHSFCPNSGLSFSPWILGDSLAEAMLVHDGRSGRRGGRGYVYLFRKQAALTLFLTLSLFRPFSVTRLRLDAQEEKQQFFSIPAPLQKKSLPFGQEVRHFGDPLYVHAGCLRCGFFCLRRGMGVMGGF